MNDIQIQTQQGKITSNLDVLKAELKEIADRYAGAVVTEDTVTLAKKDLAELRKVRTEVEDRRKAVKKEWNEPYTAFENEIKEALKIIDKPILEIDTQVKNFEQAEKEAKKETVRNIYEENVPDEVKPYMTFESIFDEKWLNKSVKDQEIIADLSAKSTQIRIDLDSIKALGSEIEEECLKAYKLGGLASAIKRNSDYLAVKAAAEVRAREEAERKIREEQERKAEQEAEKEEVKAEEVKPEKFIEPEDLPFGMPAPVFRFEVAGGENIDKVKQFLDFSEIEYKEI